MGTARTKPELSFEEGSFLIFLAILACVCLIVASKAVDPVMAFHATLGTLASIAGFVFILRTNLNGFKAPPLVINGKPNYNFGPVKFASIAALIWGIAGFTVGLWIALELAFPLLNFDLAYINFGRLRPLHTSAVIFAFGGNVLLATSFYVVQRT